MTFFEVRASSRYKRDFKRLKKAKKNLGTLQTVINLLSSGAVLPRKYCDHGLKGGLHGKRVCHIGHDWLLLYEKRDDVLLLLLVRTGTHRDVFGIE
ncbi:MAG: type II toxin-antitoxin system YafQ family toxin [Candidatus Peribacteraceae bacterium]|nr:type II toxin-antitoxin system YafQ family toxin [Candidatus Peribacteraceae bacterium]